MTNNFFEPHNIAIIGASSKTNKLGYQITKNVIDGGYKGKIYPVNLDDKSILGLKAYHSVLDIHNNIDLAVIVIPREAVSIVLKQCVIKEIPFVIIISAGFAEKDDTGKNLQKELEKIVHNTKTKIIGPNCLGIKNTASNLNLTFAATDVSKGRIGLILQSGATGSAIFDWAKKNNIGISKFISLGNKLSITEIESLNILGDDDDTQIIAMYLEDISDINQFLTICRKISTKKPIVILKGGSTPSGAKAASSHTAALSSSYLLDSALFNQANLIVADDLEEIFNILELFSYKTPDLSTGGLAIVSNAGGPAILASDSAWNNQLKLPKLNTHEQKIIAKFGNFACLDNPYDLGGDAVASDYKKIISAIEKSNSYSSILVIVTPQSSTQIDKTAETIGSYTNSDKAVIGIFLGGQKIEKALKILAKHHIAHFEDPSLAVKLLAKVYKYFQRRYNIDTEIINISKCNIVSKISDDEIVHKYNLPYVKSCTVNTKTELKNSIKVLGFPLVYKSAFAVHRGKENKIKFNIDDPKELINSANNIGYPGIVQRMIDSPYELIIGAKRDKIYGIILIFGHGGIFVEESKDISFKIWPLTVSDLGEMIEETKIWSVVKTFGIKMQLKDTLIKILKIMLENQSITEIELNPIKVLRKKIISVDINIKRVNL